MRILFVDKSEYWGGAEESLNGMVSELAGEHEIHLLSLLPRPHQTRFAVPQGRRSCRVNGMKWWMYKRWPWRIKGLGLLERLVFGWRLARCIGHLRPDVVHFNLYRRHDWIDMRIARVCGCRVVTHVRSQPHEAPLRRRVLDTADGIICISDFVCHAVSKVGTRALVRRIYNPVRPPGTGGSGPESVRIEDEPGEFVLLAPAVIEPRKGQDDAIRVTARLAARHASLRLWIVGAENPLSSGYLQSLRQLSDGLGVTGRVRFLGHCGDMAGLLRRAQVVLVLSKRGEALGRVPIEAGLCERPVIVTRAGALPEIVEDGVTGFVVEPGDIDQLEWRLESLIKDDGLRCSFGSAARKRMTSRFGIDEIGAQLRRFYRDIAVIPA